ncbi:MAG: ABC transporter [Phycisphaerae bacterium]|jgi:lipoprotein-releasing system permease protein|nr:MAG: ABC transporter [Phycisphaerae bacterium]
MIWFVSMRYLLAHARQSLVCVAGVLISVMMFITMSSMMQGFTDKFIIETVESSGHITIHDEPRQSETPLLQMHYPESQGVLVLHGSKPRDTIRKIKNPTGLMLRLRNIPGILAAAPVVNGDAIATYGTKTATVSIYGIDPRVHLQVTTVGEDLIEGSFDRLSTTADGIVMGWGLASLLGARLDDQVTLASPTGGRTIAKVVGIFQTGVTPVDYSRAYMVQSSAQTLLDKKNIINQIILRTSDYTQAREFAAQIEGICGYKTESWQEANANFLKIFRIQQIITYIITGSLMIVAAFGVLNILIMAVLERVNDIAILKSFGLSRNDITRVYLVQGLVIGLIGSALGLVFGKLMVEVLRRIPIQMEGLVKAEGLLMSEHRSDYVAAFIASMIVVLLAAVYPARRAARYDPVEVIRGAH